MVNMRIDNKFKDKELCCFTTLARNCGPVSSHSLGDSFSVFCDVAAIKTNIQTFNLVLKL